MPIKNIVRALFNSDKLKVLEDGKWMPIKSYLFPKTIYTSKYLDTPKSKEELKEMVSLSFEDWRWKLENKP